MTACLSACSPAAAICASANFRTSSVLPRGARRVELGSNAEPGGSEPHPGRAVDAVREHDDRGHAVAEYHARRHPRLPSQVRACTKVRRGPAARVDIGHRLGEAAPRGAGAAVAPRAVPRAATVHVRLGRQGPLVRLDGARPALKDGGDVSVHAGEGRHTRPSYSRQTATRAFLASGPAPLTPPTRSHPSQAVEELAPDWWRWADLGLVADPPAATPTAEDACGAPASSSTPGSPRAAPQSLGPHRLAIGGWSDVPTSTGPRLRGLSPPPAPPAPRLEGPLPPHHLAPPEAHALAARRTCAVSSRLRGRRRAPLRLRRSEQLWTARGRRAPARATHWLVVGGGPDSDPIF